MHGAPQTLRSGSGGEQADHEPSEETQRRLILQAAIELGYSVRIEQRVGAGRTSTRIVQPVALEVPRGEVESKGVLVTRASDLRENRFPLDELGEVSFVTTRVKPEEERRGQWTIGEPVVDDELGFGIVKSFAGEGNGACVVVRFAADGVKEVPLDRAELRPLS